MKTKNCNPQSAISKSSMAFTIIELLVVIAIIAILAAMLLPVLNVAMTKAKTTQAKLEVNQISTAITQYESQYSRFPVSTQVQQSGMTNVTYGGFYYNNSTVAGAVTQWPLTTWYSKPWPGGSSQPIPIPQGYYTPQNGIYITNGNSEVISILMDLTNFPNSTTLTINTNHQKNPMQTAFLSAKMVSDTVSPGVGTDLNYRDPWGNQYIITIDLANTDAAEDPFYCSAVVSSSTGVAGGGGINGLVYQNPTGSTTGDYNYAFHGNVMVWSMGPNGPFNHSPTSFDYATTLPTGSTEGMALDANNKRHVLSWAQ